MKLFFTIVVVILAIAWIFISKNSVLINNFINDSKKIVIKNIDGKAYQKEDDVKDSICRECVQCRSTEDTSNQKTESQINDNDGCSVCKCIATTFSFIP